MKKILETILVGAIMFSPLSFAHEEPSLSIKQPPEKRELITQEDPVEIIGETLKTKEVRKKDVVNFIASIDAEKTKDRSKYAEGVFLDGFMLALEDQINKDPLFYAWGEYKENDIIIKNQAISAIWDVFIGRYPKVFGRVEKAGKALKRATTLETKEVYGYKFQLNPELDNNNYLRARIRLRTDKNNYLNDTHLRIGRDEATLGKTYDLSTIGLNSIFSIDFQHDYKKDYCIKFTFKLPFWFNEREKQENPKISSSE
jgi:hypothetical protein